MADPKNKHGDEKEPEKARSREDFLSLFKRGQEFTEELLQENERLRFQLVSLNEELTQARRRLDGDTVVRDLMSQIKALEMDRQRLLDQFKTVEEQNRDFNNRYLEIEEAHNNLANLYVASYQLHATLNFSDVIQITSEILLNLIGAEEFGIYVLDEDTGTLNVLVTEGRDAREFTPIALGEGRVGQSVKTATQYVAEDMKPRSPLDPLAVIPLTVGGRPVGAIVLLKLLVQKPALSTLDLEIFSLLGAHAATAIVASAQNSTNRVKATKALYERLWQAPQAREGA